MLFESGGLHFCLVLFSFLCFAGESLAIESNELIVIVLCYPPIISIVIVFHGFSVAHYFHKLVKVTKGLPVINKSYAIVKAFFALLCAFK